ncbi:DUF6571 family protein [Streptomyces sp. NPDC047130]|uniref:DUF6571 family protein n=1 Tax=Streptomyces sp. NPDC047130 TaxID=3155261 RepID=UPI0034111802
MNFDALQSANFKLLDDAVEDWSLIARNLEKLSRDAEKGLHAAATKANWAGENKQVTKAFVGKTAGEIADAHAQAKSIHGVLSDLAGELKGFRAKLREAVGRGLDNNLTVRPSGDHGFVVVANVPAGGPGTGIEVPDESQVKALRDEIQGILTDATARDESASEVLKALADQSKYGFGEASHKDRDSPAAALRQAEDLAALAEQRPGDLSPAEFDRLNAGLRKYANDPLFAERFATTLGPRKTLEFWTGIHDGHMGEALLDARKDKLGELQRNLSMTLAEATQSDSAGMAAWKNRMIDLGDQRVNGVLGFQVMSNLMRAGDFDDRFLKDYGTALMATERERSQNGKDSRNAWSDIFGPSSLNHLEADDGKDPLTGYLKALSNSPDAATDFFNQQFVSKENSPFERDTDDNGFNGKVALTNFDYLFEERHWDKATNSEGDKVDPGRNNLALALEAATTGHPAGELPGPDTPAHNDGQVKLFERIVASVSDDSERLTKHGFMSDSLGQITSEYMPDIQRAFHPSTERTTSLFPVAGSAAQLHDTDATRFLYALGRNPEGYTAVNLAQHSYTTQLMHYHFENPDAYFTDKDATEHERLKQTATNIGRTSGTVEAIIGAGRAYESETEGGKKDAEYNSAIQAAGDWGGTAVGIGVGLAVSPTAGPGAVVAAELAGAAADQIIGGITEGALKDSSGEVVYKNAQDMESARDSTRTVVEHAARSAGDNTRSYSSMIVDAAAGGANDGFTLGARHVREAIDGQGIPRQLEQG